MDFSTIELITHLIVLETYKTANVNSYFVIETSDYIKITHHAELIDLNANDLNILDLNIINIKYYWVYYNKIAYDPISQGNHVMACMKYSPQLNYLSHDY